MKRYLLLALVATFYFYGCSCCNNTSMQEVSIEEAKNLKIELRKSECYGKCPAYFMTMKNGVMKLNAVSNMPKVGMFDIKLNEKEIIELYSNAIEGNVFQNPDEEKYDQMITDLPFSKMTLDLNDSSKTIHYRSNAPKSIKKIDIAIEKIIADTNRYEDRLEEE